MASYDLLSEDPYHVCVTGGADGSIRTWAMPIETDAAVQRDGASGCPPVLAAMLRFAACIFTLLHTCRSRARHRRDSLFRGSRAGGAGSAWVGRHKRRVCVTCGTYVVASCALTLFSTTAVSIRYRYLLRPVRFQFCCTNLPACERPVSSSLQARGYGASPTSASSYHMIRSQVRHRCGRLESLPARWP